MSTQFNSFSALADGTNSAPPTPVAAATGYKPAFLDTPKSRKRDRDEEAPLILEYDRDQFKSIKEIDKELETLLHPLKLGNLSTRSKMMHNKFIIIIPKSEDDSETILSSYNKGAFNSTAIIRPAKDRNSNINYSVIIKNISIELSEEEIKSSLDDLNLFTTRLTRFKRKDGEVLKVVKIDFASEEIATKAIDNGIQIGYFSYKCIKFREKTIYETRCMNCQGFGHLRSSCGNPSRCVHCAGLHNSNSCLSKEKANCSNCGGMHKASDNRCPFKKNIVKQVRNTPLRINQSTYSGPPPPINRMHFPSLHNQLPAYLQKSAPPQPKLNLEELIGAIVCTTHSMLKNRAYNASDMCHAICNKMVPNLNLNAKQLFSNVVKMSLALNLDFPTAKPADTPMVIQHPNPAAPGTPQGQNG